MEIKILTDAQKKEKLRILLEHNNGRESDYYECLRGIGDLKKTTIII